MNFDTRTVIDLIKLNAKLKDSMVSILEDEKLFVKKNMKNKITSKNLFDCDDFLQIVSPQMKECLKLFLKKELSVMGLSVMRGIININNVDYSNVVKILTN